MYAAGWYIAWASLLLREPVSLWPLLLKPGALSVVLGQHWLRPYRKGFSPYLISIDSTHTSIDPAYTGTGSAHAEKDSLPLSLALTLPIPALTPPRGRFMVWMSCDIWERGFSSLVEHVADTTDESPNLFFSFFKMFFSSS